MPRETTNFARLEMLDVVRFIASVGVIVLHASALAGESLPIGHLGRFAVPFFTIIAVALTVDGMRRNQSKPMLAYGKERLLRIYLPFLVWTLAYILFRDFKCLLTSDHSLVPIDWLLLIVGSAHHLWFLPFILVATLLAAGAARFVLFRLSPALLVPVAFGAGALVLQVVNPWSQFSSASGDGLNLGYFITRSWNMLPAAFFGVGLGCVWPKLCTMPYRSLLACLGLAVMVLSLVLGPFFKHALVLQHISGLGAVFFALGPWRNRLTRMLADWGQAAYGIYLVHVLWYLALDLACRKSQIPIISVTVVFIIIATIILSTGSGVLLAKSRYTAWMLGIVIPQNNQLRPKLS